MKVAISYGFKGARDGGNPFLFLDFFLYHDYLKWRAQGKCGEYLIS
jgi:hypothetical protein